MVWAGVQSDLVLDGAFVDGDGVEGLDGAVLIDAEDVVVCFGVLAAAEEVKAEGWGEGAVRAGGEGRAEEGFFVGAGVF